MNERIKELELQAADGTVDPNGPFTAEEFNNFTKKFAELIINDVMNELFVVYPGGKNGSDVKFQNITARQWINQVFGVER
jgi:hypothetical protein